METVSELRPEKIRRTKSFYGKARVHDDGRGNRALVSYRTAVCWVDAGGGFHKTWDGWSATTARHVDEFRVQNGMGRISKREWEALECERTPPPLWGARL